MNNSWQLIRHLDVALICLFVWSIVWSVVCQANRFFRSYSLLDKFLHSHFNETKWITDYWRANHQTNRKQNPSTTNQFALKTRYIIISHNCKCHRFVCIAISIKSMLCCLDRIILNKIIIHLRQCHCFRVIMNEMIFATKLNCPIEIIAMPIIKWIQRYIYICCNLQWKHPFHSNQFPIKCSTDWNIWHNSDKLCSLLFFLLGLWNVRIDFYITSSLHSMGTIFFTP